MLRSLPILLIAVVVALSIGLPLAYLAFVWLPEVSRDLRDTERRATATLDAVAADSRRIADATVALLGRPNAPLRATVAGSLAEAQRSFIAATRAIESARKTSDAVTALLGEPAKPKPGTVAQVLIEMPPAIESSGALLTDAKATLDELYHPALALLETANTLSRSGAEVAREAEAAAPDARAAVADVRKITRRMASPWSALWGALKNVWKVVF